MTQESSPHPDWNEEDRLKALNSYGILDTPIENDFEDIVKMAARVCSAPVSVISLIAGDRQWFKAEIGLGVRETPLDISICAKAILQPGIFTVPDLTKDSRFKNNPLIKGDPHLRFYAGALLETPDGLPLGTMCILDYKPRTLTAEEADTLKTLARQVMTLLELRRALNAKSQSEERLTLALNASGFIGIWEWDIVKDLVYADSRFISVFGGEGYWSTEGAPVAEYLKAIHPDDLPRVSASIERVLQSKDFFQEEYRLVQKDGSVKWIEARGQCQFDNQGKPLRFPGVATDITARKNVEQKEREAAARFQFMAESMPQKIWTATPTGEIDFFNHQWMEFTGLSFEKIRDWGWGQFIHPEDLDYTVDTYKRAISEEKPFEMQQRFRRKDGVYRWHLARGAPMRDSNGKVIMWMGSNTDIDDQRRANESMEQALTRAEFLGQLSQKLSSVSNPSEINKITTEQVGRYLTAGRCYFFQVSSDAKQIHVLPDWRNGTEATLEGIYQLADFGLPERWQALKGSSVCIDDVRTHPWTKDFTGNYQPTNIVGCVMAPFVHEGKLVACIGVGSSESRQWTADETHLLENVMQRVWPLMERARIELELREREETLSRIAAVVEFSEDAIITKSLEGIILSWNAGAERVFGYKPEEIIGKSILELIPAELRYEEPRIIERLKKGQRIEHYETVRLGKGGRRIDISLTVSPVKDRHGKIVAASTIARDVTEEKKRQETIRENETRFRDELERLVTERTASLQEAVSQMEEFSYSVSHDLRAPLRAMQGYANALLEDYREKIDEEGQEYLKHIVSAGHRMDRLTHDVLVYSKIPRHSFKLHAVDIDRLVSDIVQQNLPEQAKNASISVEKPLLPVLGNESFLAQCVSNLIDNAVKFASTERPLRVRIWTERHGEQVRLSFEDNGIGILPEHQHRVWGMFERIHPRELYEGTGIGLAIVRKTVERMNGTMGLESDGVTGSKFWIQLPEIN